MGTDTNYFFDGQGPGVAINAPRMPIFRFAGALTNQFAGQAPEGAQGYDTVGKKWYINGGTLAAPLWKIITSA